MDIENKRIVKKMTKMKSKDKTNEDKEERRGNKEKVNIGNEMWTKNRKRLCKIMKRKQKRGKQREEYCT